MLRSRLVRLSQEDLLAGRLRDAAVGFEELAGQVEDPSVGGMVRAGLVECRLARGDRDRARAALGTSTPAPGTLSDPWVSSAAGEVAWALGDVTEALAHQLHAGHLLGSSDSGPGPAALPWRASAALAMIGTGERHRALTLAREHLDRATAAGCSYATAQALRVLAVAETGGRREVLLRKARRVLADVEAARLAAQVDADLAGVLLMGGRPGSADHGEAQSLLRGVVAYATAEDLWPLHSRAHRLLEQHSRASGTDDTPWDLLQRLTAAERRIVEAALGGLTNREIAGRFEISVKAVEWHLSRVYRKLGLRSRRELREAMGASSVGPHCPGIAT